MNEAASGDREIHLYDEAGYTALRKAMRSDQEASSVPSLATVILSHSTGNMLHCSMFNGNTYPPLPQNKKYFSMTILLLLIVINF